MMLLLKFCLFILPNVFQLKLNLGSPPFKTYVEVLHEG